LPCQTLAHLHHPYSTASLLAPLQLLQQLLSCPIFLCFITRCFAASSATLPSRSIRPSPRVSAASGSTSWNSQLLLIVAILLFRSSHAVIVRKLKRLCRAQSPPRPRDFRDISNADQRSPTSD
ncbi:hypothetical protein K402DRAFT_448222, partial [Aulographum hederae CBS 113979]